MHIITEEIQEEIKPKKSWKYSSWIDNASRSPYFESFKVYIIRCYDEYESFIKIGKTYTSVEARFTKHKDFPYQFEIIKIISFEDGKLCSDFEVQLHKENKKLQYYPLQRFAGDTECFYMQILEKKDICQIIK